MNIVVNKNTDVIVVLAVESEILTNGIEVKTHKGEHFILGEQDIFAVYENIETPVGVEPQTHKYSPDFGFIKNSDYAVYVSTDEKVKQLEDELLNTKLALAELVETIMEGGGIS